MIRIYLPEGQKLLSEQVHYINNVMRKSKADYIQCFNENGEWLCDVSGNRIKKIREPEIRTNKTIAIGCIKKHRLEILVEKATEIGVTHLQLLTTTYSQRVNYDFPRLRRISIEAAEQSGWLEPITILPAISLETFLNKNRNLNREIAFCHPGETQDLTSKISTILIGPEGGWSPEDILQMQELQKVSLGNSILRSETAAMLAGYLLCN
jgi:16S rRNA (uracil1498-N3)-methyltransferase